MPELKSLYQFDNLTPAELDEKRRIIVMKAQGNFENLSEDDLHILAALAAALRKRTAGPPKEAKPKAEKVKKNISAQEVMDLI